MPERLHKRILKPSGRGRKPNTVLSSSRSPTDFGFPATSLSSYASLANASMLSSYKLPMGFGALPGLGFNPMYAASLASFGMMPGLKLPDDDEEEKPKESSKEKSKEKSSSTSKSSSSTSPSKSKSSPKSTHSPTTSASSVPHPSFPLMYNPLMFNPLFAQSLGGFTLPTGLPTSFASLANQSKLLNGVGDSDDDTPPSKHSKSDKDDRKSSKHLSAKEILAKDLSAKHNSKTLSSKNLSAKDMSVKDFSLKGMSAKDLTSSKHQSMKDMAKDLSVKSHTHSSSAPQDLSVKKKTKEHHSLHHNAQEEVQDLSAPVDFSSKSKSHSSLAATPSLLSSLSQIGKKPREEQPVDLVKKDSKPKRGLGDIIGKLKAVKEKEVQDLPGDIIPPGRSLLKPDLLSPTKSASPSKDKSPKNEAKSLSADIPPSEESKVTNESNAQSTDES